jgi:hypothetical protein
MRNLLWISDVGLCQHPVKKKKTSFFERKILNMPPNNTRHRMFLTDSGVATELKQIFPKAAFLQKLKMASLKLRD